MLGALIVIKSLSIFLPDNSLFLVDLFLINFFLFLLFNLSCQVFSHLSFLFFTLPFSSVLFFLLFSQLVFDMFHHLLIFSSNLLFLILDHWVSKWSHDGFDFVLSFFFLLLSFSFKFVLKSGILFLSFDILNKDMNTSNLSLSAYYLNLCWFYSFSTMICWNLFLSLIFLSSIYCSSRVISSLIFWTKRWSSSSSFLF